MAFLTFAKYEPVSLVCHEVHNMPAGFGANTCLRTELLSKRVPAGRAATNNSVQSNNWRTNAKPVGPDTTGGGSPTGLVSQFDAVTVATTNRTRGAFLRVAKRGSAPANWQIGQIVEIPNIAPTLNPNVTNADYKVPTIVGPICPKIRKAVIVAMYASCMIVLPMFSCEGRGTTRKSAAYRTMSMTVANHAENRNEITSLYGKECLYVGDTWLPKGGTHICLNQPLTVSYGWPIHPWSVLDPQSIALLRSRYRIACSIGYHDIGRQESLCQDGVRSANQTSNSVQPRPQTSIGISTSQSNRSAWGTNRI
ncbi:hypothetical protein OHC33_008139 [Knufia fluminis]|uniref:Uncharacterized protein n=1 Tax=Knufia fluminis TaxID=191047 RepID=A0AAN8F3X9_9EURO|nr:hypothetical protein OHC33_008139 [Knufia fluminis]